MITETNVDSLFYYRYYFSTESYMSSYNKFKRLVLLFYTYSISIIYFLTILSTYNFYYFFSFNHINENSFLTFLLMMSKRISWIGQWQKDKRIIQKNIIIQYLHLMLFWLPLLHRLEFLGIYWCFYYYEIGILLSAKKVIQFIVFDYRQSIERLSANTWLMKLSISIYRWCQKQIQK